MKKRHLLRYVLFLAAFALSPDQAASAEAVEVRYLIWEPNQLQPYQQCALQFEQSHPGIRIRISQVGWSEYWTQLATGFVSGTAPDVFVNHRWRIAEFTSHGQLADLAPLIARDRLNAGDYDADAWQLWQDGAHQYGIPKDWDTVALLVNLRLAEQAGLGGEALAQLNWNPVDGGTFEQAVRRMTRDIAGRNGASPDFDPSRVEVYGFQLQGNSGLSGQTDWGPFAVTNGFRFQDAANARLRLDDPRLAETLAYLRNMVASGLSASPEHTRSLGADAMFVAQRTAMIPQGVWMAGYFYRYARFPHLWVPLPTGPDGQRATMFNSVADSIWSGSRVKEPAWEWIRYMASYDCQKIVAREGAALPALKRALTDAVAALQERGVDVGAFFTMRYGTIYPMPVVSHPAQADELVGHAVEATLLGREQPITALGEAAQRLSELQR